MSGVASRSHSMAAHSSTAVPLTTSSSSAGIVMEGALKKRGANLPVMRDRYCVASWELDDQNRKYALLRSFKSHDAYLKHPHQPVSTHVLKCISAWNGKGNFHHYPHAFVMETKEKKLFHCSAPSAEECARWIALMEDMDEMDSPDPLDAQSMTDHQSPGLSRATSATSASFTGREQREHGTAYAERGDDEGSPSRFSEASSRDINGDAALPNESLFRSSDDAALTPRREKGNGSALLNVTDHDGKLEPVDWGMYGDSGNSNGGAYPSRYDVPDAPVLLDSELLMGKGTKTPVTLANDSFLFEDEAPSRFGNIVVQQSRDEDDDEDDEAYYERERQARLEREESERKNRLRAQKLESNRDLYAEMAAARLAEMRKQVRHPPPRKSTQELLSSDGSDDEEEEDEGQVAYESPREGKERRSRGSEAQVDSQVEEEEEIEMNARAIGRESHHPSERDEGEVSRGDEGPPTTHTEKDSVLEIEHGDQIEPPIAEVVLPASPAASEEPSGIDVNGDLFGEVEPGEPTIQEKHDDEEAKRLAEEKAKRKAKKLAKRRAKEEEARAREEEEVALQQLIAMKEETARVRQERAEAERIAREEEEAERIAKQKRREERRARKEQKRREEAAAARAEELAQQHRDAMRVIEEEKERERREAEKRERRERKERKEREKARKMKAAKQKEAAMVAAAPAPVTVVEETAAEEDETKMKKKKRRDKEKYTSPNERLRRFEAEDEAHRRHKAESATPEAQSEEMSTALVVVEQPPSSLKQPATTSSPAFARSNPPETVSAPSSSPAIPAMVSQPSTISESAPPAVGDQAASAAPTSTPTTAYAPVQSSTASPASVPQAPQSAPAYFNSPTPAEFMGYPPGGYPAPPQAPHSMPGYMAPPGYPGPYGPYPGYNGVHLQPHPPYQPCAYVPGGYAMYYPHMGYVNGVSTVVQAPGSMGAENLHQMEATVEAKPVEYGPQLPSPRTMEALKKPESSSAGSTTMGPVPQASNKLPDLPDVVEF